MWDRTCGEPDKLLAERPECEELIGANKESNPEQSSRMGRGPDLRSRAETLQTEEEQCGRRLSDRSDDRRQVRRR